RGADVVVGTPGRVIDHLTKGTLNIQALQTLVLDEADEMLRMGFIDDVKNVLERIPDSCQKALFSATMPDAIRRIADKHLNHPQHITIRAKTTTAANIHQRYWIVGGVHKLDALTRILEVEPFDAMLVFARTRVSTEELAGRLEARGFSAAALNGDVPQKNREKIVEQLKRNEIDILVATDVAARGLDVERISHVVNYDIPYDTEAYVHRIGRTGRAGRSGEAILFVAPRERNMLRAIERATRQPIEAMTLPTVRDVNEQRVARFQSRIEAALESDEIGRYHEMVQSTQAATGASLDDIAAALALLAKGDEPLLLEEPAAHASGRKTRADRADAERDSRPHGETRNRTAPDTSRSYQDKRQRSADADLVTYRVAIGHAHGAKPGNIVGAIANEAGLSARQIGRIEIHDQYSQVDLPANLSNGALEHLKKVWVAGQQLQIVPDDGSHPDFESRPRPAPSKPTRPKSGFSKSGFSKSGFSKPGQSKPARSKPDRPKSANSKPAHAKPAYAKPSPSRPDPSESRPERAKNADGERAPTKKTPFKKAAANRSRPPRTRSERKAAHGARKTK
ncbi:MAG: DbpA RNA binding domain-containing protein, partial [Xanthomonadaceae bacterium]|nr:DbpA RNA binding domain-containing protein [Xanthomonadaceae bacterium]